MLKHLTREGLAHFRATPNGKGDWVIFNAYTSFLAWIPALLKERTALFGKTPLGRKGG